MDDLSLAGAAFGSVFVELTSLFLFAVIIARVHYYLDYLTAKSIIQLPLLVSMFYLSPKEWLRPDVPLRSQSFSLFSELCFPF